MMHTIDMVIATWRDKLSGILGFYEDYREGKSHFWRNLFIAFFVLNVVCYEIAIITAFPERAFGPNWLRYILIAFPVGILGAVFDCVSFVATVAIVRHAVKVASRFIYLGHIGFDLIVALLATGWVLIVFSVSTVLVDFAIGPPVPQPPAQETVVAVQPAVSAAPQPAPSNPEVTVQVTPAPPPQAPAVKTEPGLDHAAFLADRSKGYGERLSSAISNPFSADNLKNIYFGVVMGGSAMLPSLVHLYIGLMSLFVIASQTGRRRNEGN